jgi:O-acetyl-ADP-ribose deacetylase (regulator of RNase III)
MKIILADINGRLVAEWQRAFSKYNNFEFKCQNIVELKADAVVSPSNSYAIFSGGVDLVYRNFFGPQFEKDLQEMVKARPMRELLVGESLVVKTGHKDIPHLIACPTMRTALTINDTSNPYLAFKAALIASRDNGFETILCPGMGTATGNVKESDAARQMTMAYSDFIDKFPKYPANIRESYLRHQEIVGLMNLKRKVVYA